MGRKYLYHVMIFLFLSYGMALPALAGEPTEQIKQTTDKILAIVSNPAMKVSEKNEERRKLIREAINERFDWEEMARRTLARQWVKRTEEEKREFISLYAQLLERTYMDKVEGYAGEKVVYEGDAVEGEYAIVKIVIKTTKDTEIPVKYRLKKKGNGWLVYDISIEGVSLVNNYRVQFNNIISRSSYESLVKKLKSKVDEQQDPR